MHRKKIIALVALLAGCQEPGDDFGIGESNPRVEAFKTGSYFELAFEQVGAKGDYERATGAILVPWLYSDHSQKEVDGNPLRGTCGVTFVTPSHAITAAHCVRGANVYDPPNQTLTVEMYTVADTLNISGLTALNGTYPNFSSPLNNPSGIPGYQAEAFDCELVARCGTSWGPMVDCNLADADVALVRCDDEPGTKYGYVDDAESESVGEFVFMPWKHEVYDADLNDPDHFDNYVDYSTTNYHYFEEGRLLPLRSKSQWYGDLLVHPRSLFPASSTPVTWTNLFGCHGTSGSGVGNYDSQAGVYRLLGPAVNPSQMGGLLCHPSTVDIFKAGISYTNLARTSELVERAQCGDLNGSLLAWIRCHRDRFYEEEVKFPDFGFDWPMWNGNPVERWRVRGEPTAEYPIGRPQLTIPFGKLTEGTQVRISVHVVVSEGKADAPVELWVGDERVASLEFDGEQSSAKLTAALTVSDPSAAVSVRYKGKAPIGLTEMTIEDNEGTNRLDTMAARAGLGLVGEDGALEPMRFEGDGEEGFAARLLPGETMAITRQAFVEGASEWKLRMRTSDLENPPRIFAYDAFSEKPVELDVTLEDGIVHAAASELELPVAFTVNTEEAVRLDDISISAAW